MGRKTDEYNLVEKKLNRDWVWNRIITIFFIIITMFLMISATAESHDANGTIVNVCLIVIIIGITLSIYFESKKIKKYKEVRKPVKLEKKKVKRARTSSTRIRRS